MNWNLNIQRQMPQLNGGDRYCGSRTNHSFSTDDSNMVLPADIAGYYGPADQRKASVTCALVSPTGTEAAPYTPRSHPSVVGFVRPGG